MECSQIKYGFTLVEVIIVIAIISILVAILIPNYNNYFEQSQQGSCLSEVKNYSNSVFYILNDQGDEDSPVAPNLNACQSITDATGWTLDTWQEIEAIAKAPSNARIVCDIPNGTPCIILP